MLIIVPKPVLISVNAKGENMKLMIPILFISSILFAGDNTTRVKVSGMMCSYSCVSKVNTVVKNIDGVKSCSVDFDKGEATVVYDDEKVASKDIVNILTKKTDFKVSELADDIKSNKTTSEKPI